MFGLDSLLSSPTVVRVAAKSAGIEAARLDVNPASGELLASIKVHGHVKQVRIPTHQTFTIEEILTLLFPDPAQPAELRDRPLGHAKIETIIGSPP